MKKHRRGNNMFTIFRVLLAVIHLLHTLLLTIQRHWANVRRRCVELWYVDSRTDIEILVTSVSRMKRIPGHLVIILGREDPSFLDLVRVIGWCVTAGIPCVSFYDHNGVLRKVEGILRREVIKLKPDLMEHIDWNTTSLVKTRKNGVNGTKYKTRVQLLSYPDGKGEVASLTRTLSKAVTAGMLKVEEINSKLLEEKLELGGIPDPDLAFICGDTRSTYGLLPWHIRTTEFFLLTSHHNLSVKTFVNLLEKYARCEQRYGK